MKGTFLGTPGGAEPPFTPTVTAWMPAPAKIGIALRVKPGTSLCAAAIPISGFHPHGVRQKEGFCHVALHGIIVCVQNKWRG